MLQACSGVPDVLTKFRIREAHSSLPAMVVIHNCNLVPISSFLQSPQKGVNIAKVPWFSVSGQLELNRKFVESSSKAQKWQT